MIESFRRNRAAEEQPKGAVKNEKKVIFEGEEYSLSMLAQMLSKKDFAQVRENFTSINKNYDDFFRANIKSKNYEVDVNAQVKEQRVL